MDTLFGCVHLLISGTQPNSSYSTTPYKVPLNSGAYKLSQNSNISYHSALTVGTSIPSFDTATFKFYDASIFLGSSTSSGYAISSSTTVPDIGWPFDLPFGTSFCFEAWVNLTSLANDRPLFSTGPAASSNTRRMGVFVKADGSLVAGIYDGSYYAAVRSISSAPSTIAINTWYHISISFKYETGTLYLFLDGVLIGSEDGSISDDLITGISIGNGYTTTSSIRGAAAYYNDIRLTVGDTRHTATFTPPGALFGTISGVTLDHNGDPFSTYVMAVPHINNDSAFADIYNYPLRKYSVNSWSTKSSSVDGSFSLFIPKTEVSVIYQAPSGAPTLLNDMVHRVEPG